MMEYLILNEESLPFPKKSDLAVALPLFFKILDDALASRMKAIRVSGHVDAGWFELVLAEQLTLREWLNGQERELKQRIKSIITKTHTPQIPEEEVINSERFGLSDFTLQTDRTVATPSLGAAYLVQQLALSAASAPYWLPASIPLWHKELTTQGDLTEEEVLANNCSSWDDWSVYIEQMTIEQRENLKKGNTLWQEREKLYPRLKFADGAAQYFTKLGISNTIYGQLISCLEKLNMYCGKEDVKFSLEDIKASTGLNISDESDTVKQNPKLRAEREFRIEGKKYFFGYHVKNFSGAMRLHFKVFPEQQMICIGYFGNHLST